MARPQMDLTDERKSPIRAILWLAWPLFLEQILTTLVSYADQAMVGALGVQATAAVSISNSFVFLINGVVIAMGVGLTAYIARSVGAKNYEAAKSYIRHAFLLLIFIGLPMALLVVGLHRHIPMWMGAGPDVLPDARSYLLITSLFRIFTMAMMVLGSVFRGRGDTKTPLRINILTNILNVVGNYLLINPSHTLSTPAFTIPLVGVEVASISIPIPGAGWGVAGAALSTGFSWLVGGVLLAVMLFTRKDPTRISLRDSFRPDFALVRRVVTLSLPAMGERFLMSLSGIVVTRVIASLGTIAVAANSVYLTAESISYMPAFAFATAATTLVGQALGARKPRLAEKYAWYTVAIGGILMVAAGVLLYVFAEPLVRIFTPDPDAIALAKTCLQITAFVQPIQSTAWILAGGLRGAGDTKWPFIFTAIGNWGPRTLGALLCVTVFHMGLEAAVFCTCLDIGLRCVLCIIRFMGGKWKTAIEEQEKAAASA